MGNLNKVLAGVAFVLAGTVSAPVLAGGKVNVMLQEWRIVADSKTVSPGEVTITVQNRGKEKHEMVLLKTDLPFDQLTMSPDGGVDEKGGGGTIIDEMEDIDPKMIKSMTVKLEPGHYVLLCNMVEQEAGKLEEHYKMGMRVPLTVK